MALQLIHAVAVGGGMFKSFFKGLFLASNIMPIHLSLSLNKGDN